MNPYLPLLFQIRTQTLPRQSFVTTGVNSSNDPSFTMPVAWPIGSKSLRTILVPLDFSPESLNVAMFGILLAQLHEAKIILFHAVSLNLTPIGPANPDWLKEALRIDAQDKAQALLLTAQKLGVTAVCDIEMGPPATAILHGAERWQADLIVLTQGLRSWWTRWLGSSIVNHVIQNAGCGVMVVQPSP